MSYNNAEGNARMWKYYALASAIFAALTALLAKVGVRDVDPHLATAIRVTFILILVWGIVLAGGNLRNVVEIPARSLLYLFLSAITTGLSWLFYFQALHTGDVSKVAPIDKLSVPLTIILSIIILGESASWQVILGGALITAGSLILLL